MNERIKELAEQAGIAVWGDAVYMYDPKDTLDSTVMEKFAELIVKECSKVIRHGGQRKGAFGNEDLRPSEIATMIEEHFGVEE
jgi:hypothetical protein